MTNKKTDIGIYIHIPFCIRKCAYCDFLSGPAGEQERTEYLTALLQEIAASGRKEGGPYRAKTVFFGGGTPSVLPGEQIGKILESLRQAFHVAEDAEITMEANPGTLTAEKLSRYRAAGVNRLSLGLQSMKNDELRLLDRIHTREDFFESFYLAREAGFDNINVDLISALPGQTCGSWEETLEETAALKPEHISAYSLIVEEGTPFYKMYGPGSSGELLLPGEEEDRKMYRRTAQLLGEAGYRRYEISNYALPGKECLHNLCYWTGIPYLGFGLGASSCFEGRRFSNTADWEAYLKNSENPALVRTVTEELTEKSLMEEFCFLGLRLSEGIDRKEFEERFKRPFGEVYGGVERRFVQMGLLEVRGRRLRLTEQGIDLSNQVMCEFLL